MPKQPGVEWSRREREIMNILYRDGALSAEEILERMADPPTNSAVRSTLRVLEEKGHLRHQVEGRRFLYSPSVPRQKARVGALKQILSTFFDDRPDQAMAALLEISEQDLSDATLDRLARVIEEARKEGR